MCKRTLLIGTLAACTLGASLLGGCASERRGGSEPVAQGNLALAPNPLEDGRARDGRSSRDDMTPRSATQDDGSRNVPVSRPQQGAGSGSVLYLPTGSRSTSAVSVEKRMPGTVVAGQTFEYDIIVENLSANDLSTVRVFDETSGAIEVIAADPQASRTTDGRLTWTLDSLQAGETRTIRVRARASGEGSIESCTSLTYDSSLCQSVEVVQPRIQLVKTAPEEALRCDEICMTYVVTNNGTGTATDVRIVDDLPAGWVTTSGRDSVNIAVGSLAAGESKEYRVCAMAETTGEFCSPATATAAGGLSANADRTCTTVRQPVLTIVCNAPETRFIGRQAEFQFVVTNTGDAACENTQLTATVPSGGVFASASDNGRRSGGNVVWDLGSIPARGSRTVTMTLGSETATTLRSTARVSCVCAEAVECSSQTEFRGIPAILLEVVDLEDPVEVGGQTTYVITATNQGSAVDEQVSITMLLPASQRHVSNSGATEARVTGQTVTFQPLARLAPGAKAEWRVTVEAVAEADARVRIQMTTQVFREPVIETESTNLYR